MFPQSDVYIDTLNIKEEYILSAQNNITSSSFPSFLLSLPPKFLQRHKFNLSFLTEKLDSMGNVWCHWQKNIDLEIIYDLYYESIKHTFKQNVLANIEKMKSASTTITCGNMRVNIFFISVKGIIDFKNQKLLLKYIQKQNHTLKSVFYIQEYMTKKLDLTTSNSNIINLNVVDFTHDTGMPPIRHIEFYQFHS